MTESDEIRRRVAELLEAGLLGDAALRQTATIREPIPVAEPEGGRLHSWFVPLTIDHKLAGFAELRPDLELLRYSSFQRRPDDTARLPDLADWTDPEAIRHKATRIARDGEALGEPVLTYDRFPSRLAWALPATDPAGHARTLYVTGDHAYEAEPQGQPGTGGGSQN